MSAECKHCSPWGWRHPAPGCPAQTEEDRQNSRERAFQNEAWAIRRKAWGHPIQVDTSIAAWNERGVGPRVTLDTMIRVPIAHFPLLVESSASYGNRRFTDSWAWSEVTVGTCVSFGRKDGLNADYTYLESHANTPHRAGIKTYGPRSYFPSSHVRPPFWAKDGFEHTVHNEKRR